MPSSFVISLVSGAAAGTFTDIFFFPIDTLKTRIQAPGGFLANGGWHGVYRGLSSAFAASAPGAALFFVTYDTIKLQLDASPLSHMAAALGGETMACLVRVPAEVVKQRTQTLQHRSPYAALQAVWAESRGAAHPLNAFRKGMYRGWWSTIMREIPFTMVQFPLYEALKAQAAARRGVQQASPGEGAVCGMVAGGIAAAATTPLDVLKTRMMLDRSGQSMAELVKSMGQEGPGVWWKGVGPRVMWISLGGAVFLGGYETVKWGLEQAGEGI